MANRRINWRSIDNRYIFKSKWFKNYSYSRIYLFTKRTQSESMIKEVLIKFDQIQQNQMHLKLSHFNFDQLMAEFLEANLWVNKIFLYSPQSLMFGFDLTLCGWLRHLSCSKNGNKWIFTFDYRTNWNIFKLELDLCCFQRLFSVCSAPYGLNLSLVALSSLLHLK